MKKITYILFFCFLAVVSHAQAEFKLNLGGVGRNVSFYTADVNLDFGIVLDVDRYREIMEKDIYLITGIKGGAIAYECACEEISEWIVTPYVSGYIKGLIRIDNGPVMVGVQAEYNALGESFLTAPVIQFNTGNFLRLYIEPYMSMRLNQQGYAGEIRVGAALAFFK